MREALANAFIHRDYASAAGSVSVALYDDRLEVIIQFRNGGTPEETLGKTLGKTPDLILKRLRDSPGSSIPELAQQLDKSGSAVERAIRKLRAQGRLQRIGPAKGGHWEVIE